MTPDPSFSPPSPSLPYPQSELCLGTFMKSWGFAVHCLFQQISGWVNRQSQTLATIDSSPRISLSQLRPSPKWDQTQLIKLNDSSLPMNERMPTAKFYARGSIGNNYIFKRNQTHEDFHLICQDNPNASFLLHIYTPVNIIFFPEKLFLLGYKI